MQFIDFKYQKKLNHHHLKNINKIINKSNFILGDEVEKFEKEFAKFSEAKYAIGTSSGTDALFLALKTLNIKKGDEVIIPSHTFIATALSALYANCEVVLCDIDPITLLLDLNKLEKVITKKTKAIIPVHLYGMGVDINALKKIIKNTNIFIVEDASQAHGLNHYCNNVFKGDLSIFSLYPAKNLGAYGDSGIIITNKKNYYDKLKKLRNWGGTKKYIHNLIGYNMRMDTLQASILSTKLKKLKEWNDDRRNIANFYNKNFLKIKRLKIHHNLRKNHVFHLYVLITNSRNKLQKYLKKNNIPTIIHYPKPIHKHLAFKKEKFFNKTYPISEKICKNILSIPIYPEMKISLQKKIVKYINEFFK